MANQKPSLMKKRVLVLVGTLYLERIAPKVQTWPTHAHGDGIGHALTHAVRQRAVPRAVLTI